MSSIPSPGAESNEAPDPQANAEAQRDLASEAGFWGGDYVSEAEIGEITSRESTNVLLLVGLKGSGKTTLIASLYEHFQT